MYLEHISKEQLHLIYLFTEQFCGYRQFIEVAQEHYLSDSEKKKRHHTLAEYFLGTWSMGALRWINLPLLKQSLSADRKVLKL